MSYSGLIFNRNNAQRVEQFAEHVVFFTGKCGAAERGDAKRVVHTLPIFFTNERLLARLFDKVRDPIHRPIERTVFPTAAVRSPVLHGCPTPVVDREPETCRTFWTEVSAVDRAVGVALDVDDLPALGIDVGPAPDRAIRADAVGADGPADAGVFIESLGAVWLGRPMSGIRWYS